MASTGPGRLTVLPHEAVLLNSVRRLLAVVPQTEQIIASWASGAPSQAHRVSDSPGPHGSFLPHHSLHSKRSSMQSVLSAMCHAHAMRDHNSDLLQDARVQATMLAQAQGTPLRAPQRWARAAKVARRWAPSLPNWSRSCARSTAALYRPVPSGFRRLSACQRVLPLKRQITGILMRQYVNQSTTYDKGT